MGDFKESSETVLAMQLTRMRKYMALGKLGKTLHGQIEANGKPDIRALKGPNLDVFQDLVGLTKMQRLRVQELWEKEIAPSVEQCRDCLSRFASECSKNEVGVGNRRRTRRIVQVESAIWE
jgi:hypothetical protein